MDQLLRRDAAVEQTFVVILQDDHAAALDAFVVGVHRGADKIGERHVRDEPPALLNVEHRLFAVVPFSDAHSSGEHARIHPDERKRLGQGECAPVVLPIFARLGGYGAAHVLGALLRSAALVDR